MALLKVNGKAVPDPSEMTWELEDVSTEASGRTMDAVMHKTRVDQKRKLSLAWWNPPPEDAAAILQAFNDVTFQVTYPDALSGKEETREFCRGDPTAPVRSWAVGKKRYKTISFNVIEV